MTELPVYTRDSTYNLLLFHVANIPGAGDVRGIDCSSSNSSSSSNGNRSRVLELLERNRKVARNNGLYQFVLWREALRGAAGGRDSKEGELQTKA